MKYYFKEQCYFDTSGQRIKKIYLVDGNGFSYENPPEDFEPKVMRSDMKFLENLTPFKDYRYMVSVDVPTPLGSIGGQIPIMAIITIDIPIPKANSLEEAFDQADGVLEEVKQKMEQQKVKEETTRIITPSDLSMKAGF